MKYRSKGRWRNPSTLLFTKMNAVEKRLIEKLDELNVLDIFSLPKKEAKEKFMDILEEAYIEGFAAASFFIGADTDIDSKKLSKALDKSYKGESIYEKMQGYSDELNAEEGKRLLESEYHRVYNEAEIDYAESSGKEVLKVWKTMLDDRVRDTHSYLEGISIPIDAEFVTFDGDSAMCPGGFASAENNSNCRCYLSFKTV